MLIMMEIIRIVRVTEVVGTIHVIDGHTSDINQEINLKMQDSELRFLPSMEHLKCKVDGAVL